MGAWLKPLPDRTIAVTGASSGIGLSTARRSRARADPTCMMLHSAYTNAQIHPLATAAMVAAGVAGLAFLARSSSRA